MRWLFPRSQGNRAALRRRRIALLVAGLLILLADPLLVGQAARLRWVPRLPEPALGAWLGVAPADPVAHYAVGLRHRAAGRPAEALRSFRRSVELNPRLIPAQAALGEALFEQGEFAAAHGVTQRCLDQDPTVPLALVVLGRLHAERGEWQKAAQTASSALERDPRLPQAWLLTGRVGRARRDWQTCRRAAEETVRLMPGDANGWELLSEARLRLADAAGALEAARRAHSLDPDSNRVKTRLGQALLVSGSVPEAAAVFGEVDPVDPTAGEASAGLAEAYLASGRRADALRQALTVVERWPLENTARAIAAKVYADGGDPARAARWQREHRRWERFLAEKTSLELAQFGTSYDQRVHLRLAERLAAMGLWKDALREGRLGLQRISQPGAREFWRRLQAAHALRQDPERSAQALLRLEEPLRQLGS